MKIGKQGDSCCCTLVIQLALKFLCLYKSSFVAELAMPAQTFLNHFPGICVSLYLPRMIFPLPITM
jgi:hypothetical protein